MVVTVVLAFKTYGESYSLAVTRPGMHRRYMLQAVPLAGANSEAPAIKQRYVVQRQRVRFDVRLSRTTVPCTPEQHVRVRAST